MTVQEAICQQCNKKCPQEQLASDIAKGRMYATNEFIQCQKELEQYRALGTVEELKEAREKQINIGLALDLAWRYGQVDGSHHKMWVIDQMVRSLCGNEEEYKKWVSKYTEPLEDDDYYEWDCGIAP